MQQPLLNQAAFLSLLSHSEGTDRGADPYRVCYGFKHTIVSFANHPALTGEWMGESLASLGPQYAHSISTAAGRYQIIVRTWSLYQKVLKLPNFTPICQDDVALAIIKDRGALSYVNAGDIERACDLLCDEWASLPGANKPNQPMRSLASLQVAFANAGGVVLA